MRWYYLPLLMVFLCFAPPQSFAQSAVKPVENTQHSQADQTAQTQSPEQKEQKESFFVRTTTDPTAFFTFGIFLFTGVLAISTIGLWRQTARLAKDAERNSITTQRAFVFATNINPSWYLDPASGQYHWRFRPTWRNSGDTPTQNLRLHTKCELRNTVLPEDFSFDYKTDQIGTGILGPKFEQQGGEAPQLPTPAITVQDIIDIQSGRKFLYLMGWVRYNDVFPETPERLTRFCWQILPVGDSASYNPFPTADRPNSLFFPYVHHKKGNCADDECQI